MNETINRRGAIIGAATVLGAGLIPYHASAQSKPRTFVLVHGAWHGGWCWTRVSEGLRKKGHDVFSPTMTGLGERSHLINHSVNLSTHITDIKNVIEWESLSDIVLVAHSYGGIIASGVAEQMHEKISSIVFLDAFLPEDGDTLLGKSSPGFVEAINKAIASNSTGIKPPPSAAFGVEEADRAWVDSKTTPQPVGTYTEKAIYKGGRDKIAKRTYIRTTKYKSATFDKNLEKLKANGSWQIHEMDTGHDAMITAPQALTDILLTTV